MNLDGRGNAFHNKAYLHAQRNFHFERVDDTPREDKRQIKYLVKYLNQEKI